MKKILLLFIGFICLSSVDTPKTLYQYISLFIFLILFWFKTGFGILNLPYGKFSPKYLPLIVIAVWSYGLIIALINGNDQAGILRNFAGMIFYITFYPFLYIKPSQKDLINFLVKVSFLYSTISISKAIYALSLGTYREFNELGFTSLRFYNSIGIGIIFVPISMILFSFLLDNSNLEKDIIVGFFGNSFLSKAFTFITCTSVVILSGSKGYYFSYLFLIFIGMFLTIFKIFLTRKIKIGAFLLILLFGLISTYLIEDIIYIFSTVLRIEFDPNLSVRSIQGQKLAEEFTFLGKGLGASLKSGYSRDFLGYGFELSYHNLIHKFGAFSSLLFLNFAFPVLIALQNLFNNRKILLSSSVIGLMLYLISALGNPLIFAPISSLFNVISLYLITLSQEKIEKKAFDLDSKFTKNGTIN